MPRIGATPPYHQHYGWIPGASGAVPFFSTEEQDKDNKEKNPHRPKERELYSSKPKKKKEYIICNSRNSYY
jgi:hypothetical protein